MELARFPSRGGFSVRSIITFVLAVILTVLLWAIIGGAPAHAATDASWSGDSIVYGDHGYTKATDFKDATNTIPSGSTVYETPVQLATDTGASSDKIFILYFSPGVDPPTATSANYVEFDYSGTKTTSNPQNQKSVSLTQKGKEDPVSSCSISGVGWFICPISVFLANGMDTLFNILANLIKVQPTVLGDSHNSMFVAWNVMRNIANVAFVIAFLIIIYSQLTNLGISNYSLKKLLPRLIVAAILVNISYYITALAIDISNVMGYSVEQIFNGIRKGIFHLTNDNVGASLASPWSTVTTAILGGGGLIGGIYYVSSGGLYLLIPLLVGLALTALFVVIILAARQAIIIILVIIAPLAFVANLLPNTEKWFTKWRELFMTMLIFFPAFALVFAGSQLAGEIIMQNAAGNVFVLLFGMAVQIAPLVITPLLLKLSGSLLGRIAQIANNPRKGLMDRNRNWAKERAELRRQKNLQRPITGNPFTWGSGMVQGVENRRRRRKGLTDMYKQRADNKWHNSSSYMDIHERAYEADLEKETIENAHKAHLAEKATVRGTNLNFKTIELENSKVNAEYATAKSADMISGYRAGIYDTGSNEYLAGLQRRMAENVIQTAAWKQSEQNNQYVQQRGISNRMRTDTGLLDIAQGYGSEELRGIGRDRAQASAVATLTKLNADARQNAITLLETEAVEGGNSVKDYAIEVFRTENAHRGSVTKTRLEAALEIAAADGQVTVFDDARASENIDQEIVDAVVARHVPDMKSKGGFHVQAKPQLSLQRYLEAFKAGDTSHGTTEDEVRNAFKRDQDLARLDTLSNTTSSNLGGMKYGAFEKLSADIMKEGGLLDLIPVDANGKPIDPKQKEMVDKIFETLREGLSDPNTRATMTDRLAYARGMEEEVRKKFFATAEPLPTKPEDREAVDDVRATVTPEGGENAEGGIDATESSPTEENPYES